MRVCFHVLNLHTWKDRLGLRVRLSDTESWVQWSQIGERTVRGSIHVEWPGGSKVLHGSLFEGSREHDVLVAVCLLKFHLEAVRDGDWEDSFGSHSWEYQGIVSGTGVEQRRQQEMKRVVIQIPDWEFALLGHSNLNGYQVLTGFSQQTCQSSKDCTLGGCKAQASLSTRNSGNGNHNWRRYIRIKEASWPIYNAFRKWR